MAVRIYCQGELLNFLTNAIQKYFPITAVNLITFLWVVNNFFLCMLNFPKRDVQKR